MAIKGIFAAAVALCALPAAADAAVTVRIGNFGSDVVVNFEGSLNLAGTDRLSSDEAPTFDVPVLGQTLFRAGGSANLAYYSGFTGPDALGSGDANIVNGIGFYDVLALATFEDGTATVGVSDTYRGGYFVGTAIFRNTSFAALGLSQGLYFFRSANDSITVDVTTASVSPVPEASTWALMLAGFGMVGGAMRYRRRSVRAQLA